MALSPLAIHLLNADTFFDEESNIWAEYRLFDIDGEVQKFYCVFSGQNEIASAPVDGWQVQVDKAVILPDGYHDDGKATKNATTIIETWGLPNGWLTADL